MVRLSVAALLAVTLLSGCNQKNAIADRVEKNADRRAEAMEQASETMTNALQRNAVEQQADIVRSAGEERAQAIRESDLQAGSLSEQQQNALVAGRPVPGTSSKGAR